MFKVGWPLDAYEPMSFKLGMLNFICIINIPGREPDYGDSEKCMF